MTTAIKLLFAAWVLGTLAFTAGVWVGKKQADCEVQKSYWEAALDTGDAP